MPGKEFVREYMSVRDRVFTENLIKAAWQKSGLAPINPDIFMEDDYATAKSTSTQAHFPESYPASPESSGDSGSESDSSYASDGSDSSSDNSDDTSQGSRSEGEEEHDGRRGQEEGGNCDDSVNDQAADMLPSSESSQSPHASPSPSRPSSHHPHSNRPGHRWTRSTTMAAPNLRTLPFKSHWSLARKYEAVLTQNEALIDENIKLSSNLQAAEAHCALARDENADLKWKLNSHSLKKKQEVVFTTEARCLISEEGICEWEADKAKKAAKAREKAEKQARHLSKEQADCAAQATHGLIREFKGSLSSKTLADLRELCDALNITVPSSIKRVTKSTLISTIMEHFGKNPCLKDNPRFAKLFSTHDCSRAPKQSFRDLYTLDEEDLADNENQQPPIARQ
ncbi:hypothetical protein BDN67DRAFT_1015886 [Paxillus ammoniavirescens]|nr:hypothetical protein BDN67DRAFT_1015886 [Paxillus ammoniavirescens]